VLVRRISSAAAISARVSGVSEKLKPSARASVRRWPKLTPERASLWGGVRSVSSFAITTLAVDVSLTWPSVWRRSARAPGSSARASRSAR
jgi:hypothetical protein